jgi:hypothetical protein
MLWTEIDKAVRDVQQTENGDLLEWRVELLEERSVLVNGWASCGVGIH